MLAQGNALHGWAGVEAEVAFDALVPGRIVGCAPVDPLFVSHCGAPFQERLGIGADGMPQLPGAAFDNLANLLRDFDGRGPWGLQRSS